MQPYQNYYYPTQYQQNYQNQLQNQIQNPYMTNNIPTQVVSDFTTIQAANVPMDAIGGLFIKNDFSEIQSRRWTQDGKIVSTSYFPKIQNEGNNTSQDEIKRQNDTLDEFTRAFNDKLNTMLDRLDTIEDLITPRKRTTKKEVVDNE